MKKNIILSVLLIIVADFVLAQNTEKKIDGFWKFEIEKEYECYLVCHKNKMIKVSFWFNSNENAYIYGTPFTYFGFWDNSCYLNEDTCPKNIKDLKPTGKYMFFYDDLIIPKENKNNIGYDSLGNLYQPTRRCQWAINDELPEGLPPTTLTLYFNMNPDVYKKVEVIPNYVLSSLKKNKEDWKRYLDFIGNKMFRIKSPKSTIYNTPNNPTKMYLIKGNEVEILEQKDNWLRIRYYGKKTIEGWIKKEDVAVE
jgi:hypothetical protein